MGRVAALACAVVLASACGSGDVVATPDEDTEVLGLQVERDGESARTFEPSEPEPSASPSAPAAPSTAVSTSEPATGPASTDTPGPDPAPTAPRPAATREPLPPDPSPTPSTTPTPTPEPTGPEVLVLDSRDGHSYVTWASQQEQREDGTTETSWAEISAAPPITRGEPSEPLRVTLLDPPSPSPDGSTLRRARCQGFLEADGDVAVTARGEVRVWVMVDGRPALDRTVPVDVRLEPGQRRDLVLLDGVEVEATRHDQVTCAIVFTAR